MKFLYKIYTENQNLKNFQTQVFNLSKNYDDINNILAESISGFQDIAKNTKNEEIINEVNNRLKELKTQVESSMEQKQNEYNTQLEKKEEDINMLVKAYDNVFKEIQQKKSDKLHVQKTIEDLNSQIEILEAKLSILKQNVNKNNN
jgi:chromosome segregation ATPase